MKKKKGFTLIELLAVIVILAIIALIATPTILNIISDTKKAAVKDSTYGYVESIENKVAHQALLGNEYEDKDDYTYDEIAVDVKGTRPTYGMYSLKKGVVDEGVFCIDGYTATYADGIAEVGEKGCTEEDIKYEGSIKLSATSGNYTYPTSGTFEIIENISGGTFSCETSDVEVATCSISGTTVTVVPGKKEGSATITIKSAPTETYKEAQAAHVATTAKGLLSVTALEYKGEYDGEAHGITVTAPNSIIKYGEVEGIYNLETNPTYTDVGEYTVYYEITSAGYNTVTGSRQVIITQTEGLIELEEKSGTVEYNKTKEVKIKENKSNGKLNITLSNPNIAEAIIEDGNLKISGKKTGKTTITVVSEETKNYTQAETKYELEVIKANNELTLSTTKENYTYPESKTIEVTGNVSGGTLTCETSDKDIADCSVSGNIVTVKSGTKEGQASITIKSSATENYNEMQVVHLANTAKGTIPSVTASGYSGVYDGESHGITVSTTLSGATIKYGTTSGSYTTTTNPKYVDAGTYTVYYEITKAGYTTVTGSKQVVITKATGKITAPKAKTLTYTGSAQELVTTGISSTGEIQYKLNDGAYGTSIPKATNPGTYTVYYRVVGDKNHNDVAEQSITVTIEKATISYTSDGYTGVYDGKSHGITVIASGATIKYGTSSGNYTTTTNPTYKDAGTYTVYYQITKEGHVTVDGSETIVITKADNTLTLSATTGNYIYPTSGTFTVTENTSGGTLTCETSDSNVATCSISGNTITVVPGTKEGNATLTIKSAATTNYKEAIKAYVAITAKGTIPSVTANGYTGVYDGESHGITVSTTLSGATIKYGTTSGTYDKTASPTYTDAGTYTVYYQITKAGYTTVESSKQVVISKAENPIVVTAKTLTYTGSAQSLVTVSGAQGNVCYSTSAAPTSCSAAGTIPTGTNGGTYTVYYYVAGNTNYNAKSGNVKVTIGKKADAITITSQTYTYDGSGRATSATATSGLTPTVTYYSDSSCATKTTTSNATAAGGTPKVVGTYYATATTAGNTNYNAASKGCTKAVVINKAPNPIQLSSTTATYTYPTSGTFTVTNNVSGGDLSCTTSDSAVATCSISGTTVTVKPGTTSGSATITVKSAATTNYNEGSAAHLSTTNPGLCSVTANGYSGIYDGNAHGITVTSSNCGTVKYGTSSGSYTLTTSPTYTDIGTYTVYYQVSKAGYTTVESSKQVVIKENKINSIAKELVYENDVCKTDGTTYQYMGGCYIKGSSTNNYIWYNGFMWRIMGINSDGTVRLITDENVTTLPYGLENTADQYTTNENYIHDWLNDYFYANIKNDSIIKTGNYFCSQSAKNKYISASNARSTCSSSCVVNTTVGTISLDEYLLSGERNSYLQISQSSWTMTPYSDIYAYSIYDGGGISYSAVEKYLYGVRPIINVEGTAKVTSGVGTAKNYFVLLENKTKYVSGKLENLSTTGEYVKLEGRVYRIISKDNEGVKLILDGYYSDDETKQTISVAFGDSNIFNTTSGIGKLLNEDILNWLGLSNSNIVLDNVWYQGDTVDYASNYKQFLASTNSVTSKVGLIRLGEILATQSSTILTSKYEKEPSYFNTSTYWTMSKGSENNIFYIGSGGNSYNTSGSLGPLARPVIKIVNGVDVKSGTGTWNNPYQI